MTAEEISELAKSRTPMPDTLTLTEMWLYGALRLLYQRYKLGDIDKINAKIEKNTLIQRFGVQKLNEECQYIQSERWLEYTAASAEAEKNGCEYCKKIVKILDGRT